MLVKLQVKEKLSPKLVSDEMKQRLVNEIVSAYCLPPEILALEYHSEWHQQVFICVLFYQFDKTNFMTLFLFSDPLDILYQN